MEVAAAAAQVTNIVIWEVPITHLVPLIAVIVTLGLLPLQMIVAAVLAPAQAPAQAAVIWTVLTTTHPAPPPHLLPLIVVTLHHHLPLRTVAEVAAAQMITIVI